MKREKTPQQQIVELTEQNKKLTTENKKLKVLFQKHHRYVKKTELKSRMDARKTKITESKLADLQKKIKKYKHEE